MKLFSILLTCVVALVVAGAGAASTTTYSITDLGSLGYGVTDAFAINANGQVAGGSYTAQAIQITCPPRQYGQPKKCFRHPENAFLWSGGTMRDLGTLGGTDSVGRSINLSGEVVGSADTKAGLADGFLWNGKTMTDLGAFNAYGINDFAQVAGTCGPNPGLHACLFSDGKTTQLTDPSSFAAYDCGGSAIDNNGQIVGSCDDTSSYEHAVLWQSGSGTDLGTFGGPQASAAAVNIWSGGKMTDLGLNFFPAAINDNGVVVGGNEIYSNGTLQDLDNLIPPGSPYQIQSATGINDNGQIVADAYDTATYQRHALLLTPSG